MLIKIAQAGSLDFGDAFVQVEPAGGSAQCQGIVIVGDPECGSTYRSVLNDLKQKYGAENAKVYAVARNDTPDWVILARLETALLRASAEGREGN